MERNFIHVSERADATAKRGDTIPTDPIGLALFNEKIDRYLADFEWFAGEYYRSYRHLRPIKRGRPAGSIKSDDEKVTKFKDDCWTVNELEETLANIMSRASNPTEGKMLCQLYMWRNVAPDIERCGNRKNRPKPLSEKFWDEFRVSYANEKERAKKIEALMK